jgi:hypothetical protein
VEGEVQGQNSPSLEVESDPPPDQVSSPMSSLETPQLDVRGPPRRADGEDHNIHFLEIGSVPPPGPISCTKSSLETPKLDVRGPTGWVKGEVQVKDLSFQFDNFPSLDIRFKKDDPPADLFTEDQRSASTEVLTRWGASW